MEEIGSVKKYRFRNVRDFESLVNNNVNVLDNIKHRMHRLQTTNITLFHT